MFKNVTLPLLVMATLVSVNAAGDEGRLEINQTCAVNGGCFSGDDSGFPVQITESGSYVLTSNLDLPADPPGIVLADDADGSSIDLNGFAIRGPETCSGTPVTDCTGSQANAGINGWDEHEITVRDGTVSGMSGTGIYLGEHARLINIRAMENGLGVSVSGEATLDSLDAYRNEGSGVGADGFSNKLINISATGNGRQGIVIGQDSALENCTANNNGIKGIVSGGNAAIVNCVASQNGGAGIQSSSGSTIRGSVFSFNDKDGVNAPSGGVVIVNTTARNNGEGGFDVSEGSVIRSSQAVSNTGNGIFLRRGNSSVIDSTVNNNGDDGIDCDPNNTDAVASGVKGNVLIGNASLALRGCTEIGTNLCGGGTSC